jgi:hypothetical protein
MRVSAYVVWWVAGWIFAFWKGFGVGYLILSLVVGGCLMYGIDLKRQHEDEVPPEVPSHEQETP